MADAPFTAEDGFAAQSALRDALDMGPARFDMPQIVRMLGDEISAHRKAGRDWDAIAATIEGAVGRPVDADEISRLHEKGAREG